MGSGSAEPDRRSGLIRFGPAGWSYPDWRGIVYPDPSPRGFDPLAFISGYFDTLEINSTFYRPARPDVARRWARRVEGNPDFRFTVKLWRRFTHARDDAWSPDDVGEARGALDELADRGVLGAVLVQFPWSFKATDESVEWLDDLVGAFSDLPLAIEVRHASWNRPRYYQWLGARRLAFVNIDQPLFGRSIEPSAKATSRVGYVRLHGRNYDDWFREGAGRDARYDYLYSAEELRPWSDRIREMSEGGDVDDVYVIANNHYRGQAAANALMLAAMLRGSPQKAPETLVRAFPDALRGYVRSNGSEQRRLL